MLVDGGVNLKNIPSISEIFPIIAVLIKICPYVEERSSYFFYCRNGQCRPRGIIRRYTAIAWSALLRAVRRWKNFSVFHSWSIYLLHTYSMVQNPSWEAKWFAASQEIPRIFMEPEGSSPHSQSSATCPCPGPAQSSPHTHIPPPGDPSQYYPPIYA